MIQTIRGATGWLWISTTAFASTLWGIGVVSYRFKYIAKLIPDRAVADFPLLNERFRPF
jgi:hypothetical protein